MALQQWDEGYQIGCGVIEIDAATFGRRATGNQGDVLVVKKQKIMLSN